MSKQSKQLGEEIWKTQTEKINSELFTLTYGSIVSQLCKDYNYDYSQVNQQLFKMGYNIGIRLIEEFLQKTQLARCSNLKETAELISKVGFKMFLNITPTISHWSPDGKSFQLGLTDNPLSDFVELPDEEDEIDEEDKGKGKARKELWYSNILCGVLTGGLEMVQLDCEVGFLSDVLKGDPSTEIKVKLLQVLKDEIPAGDE